MDYLVFRITCAPPFDEILIAELAAVGFESFMETDNGIEAYVGEPHFDKEACEEVFQKYSDADIMYVQDVVHKVNWNEEWEKNYDPILIGQDVYVRASFHAPKDDVRYQIVINPKMSFGTGHHATTYLMMRLLLEQDLSGKKVLDVGSGTGILAILVAKMGANFIQAFDIDEWCVENGNENFAINDLLLKMEKGTILDVGPKGPFDVILANINMNVLMEEMSHYVGILNPGGKLIISGFYRENTSGLVHLAEKLGLAKEKEAEREQWVVIQFQKPMQVIKA
ncbi:50S ribosomal protein L11 methyltransferase [Pleomorphovibrio marinus]|uniref:50S ribosomal protein L11 methyltransferase n=1 Tax=Pleomorphovibrio marinus TaxID=2164132 RepID=UPI000E0C4198|nr:50S ribosomal protein L11 methyltransferase [Pleomorphovibrio marinus]